MFFDWLRREPWVKVKGNNDILIYSNNGEKVKIGWSYAPGESGKGMGIRVYTWEFKSMNEKDFLLMQENIERELLKQGYSHVIFD